MLQVTTLKVSALSNRGWERSEHPRTDATSSLHPDGVPSPPLMATHSGSIIDALSVRIIIKICGLKLFTLG